MSYDLQVFGATPLEVADVRAIGEVLGGSRVVGDAPSDGFVVERKIRDGFDYAFNVDGPLRVDQEDLPEEVVSAAAGIRWTCQLTVEGSGGPAIELARRFARELAQRTDGVVFDPQEDAVVWPRGGRRKFKPEPARKIDLVRFEWFVRREDAAPDLPALVFDVVRSHLPEALPRRFGSFESLQGRLDEIGREGFLVAWHAEPMTLFWKGTSPCLGGSMHGLGDELIGAQYAGEHPVGSVGLSFDSRAFLDAPWREDAVELFVELGERLPAFFAHADVDGMVGYSRGNVWYEADTITNPGLMVRNVWMGLPSFHVWLAWFGGLCRPLVERSLPSAFVKVRSSGILVRTSDMPATESPGKTARRRRPFSRGEPNEEVRLSLPAHLVLKVAGNPPGAWERERADFVPEDLQAPRKSRETEAHLWTLERRALTGHLRGATTLYSTYWVRFPQADITFERAVANSETLIRAASDAGVRRIVHVSITNPSKDSPFEYFRGKARVEEMIRDSGLGYSIIRPTVIFGREDILINNIAYILRRLPVFGIPGSGSYRLRPVAVEDVAEICVRSGLRDTDEVIDAVGPEIFTFKELVRLIARAIGRRRLFVHVPPAAALTATTAIGRVVSDVVVTRDELEGLMAGLVTTEGPATGTRALTE